MLITGVELLTPGKKTSNLLWRKTATDEGLFTQSQCCVSARPNRIVELTPVLFNEKVILYVDQSAYLPYLYDADEGLFAKICLSSRCNDSIFFYAYGNSTITPNEKTTLDEALVPLLS